MTQNHVGCKARVGSTPTSGTTRYIGKPKPLPQDRALLAYVVGVAIGDGNLSNPNGRATKLRITCDARYPKLADKIKEALQRLLPYNKVSVVQKRGNCFDIVCHSNHWEFLLGWRVGKGSKIEQEVTVPAWIKENDEYRILCLRGLIETDGCTYFDRGYPMVMFATAIPRLAEDVKGIIESLGFHPHTYKVHNGGARYSIYHIRLSKQVLAFLSLVRPEKQ